MYPAQTLYQSFKETFVAHWNSDEDVFITLTVTDFLLDNQALIDQALAWEALEDEIRGHHLSEEAAAILGQAG